MSARLMRTVRWTRPCAAAIVYGAIYYHLVFFSWNDICYNVFFVTNRSEAPAFAQNRV